MRWFTQTLHPSAAALLAPPLSSSKQGVCASLHETPVEVRRTCFHLLSAVSVLRFNVVLTVVKTVSSTLFEKNWTMAKVKGHLITQPFVKVSPPPSTAISVIVNLKRQIPKDVRSRRTQRDKVKVQSQASLSLFALILSTCVQQLHYPAQTLTRTSPAPLGG